MPAKERIGTVVSNKMQKTIVVAVQSKYQSHLYSKFKIRTKRYLAHDEFNECKIGDQVIVKETRPLSRKKCWILKQVLNKDTLTI
jgi:small subunit ribosomal protein S17